jgi:hypothetical protein
VEVRATGIGLGELLLGKRALENGIHEDKN